jgi:hypothetical protein
MQWMVCMGQNTQMEENSRFPKGLHLHGRRIRLVQPLSFSLGGERLIIRKEG